MYSYHFFKNSFAFCIHLGKYDFSYAIEYCLISHKSLDRKRMSPKNMLKILIYFHEIYLHVIFETILSFHRIKFS